MVKIWMVVVLLLAAVPLGQAQLFSTKTQPAHYAYTGAPVVGVASFYGARFEGGKTATGATFRHAQFTGASNHFKMGTWVEVKNLRNGRKVVVLVNDKMHVNMSRKGRVIDLTLAAAREINMVQQGLAKVSVKPIRPGEVDEAGGNVKP